MKRQLFLVLFILTLSTIIHSCCKGCPDDYISNLTFKNFTLTDLERLEITSYVKNSNFTTVIDSFYIDNKAQQSDEGIYISLPTEMDIAYDWKIKVINIKTSYTITNFITEKKSCFSCGHNHTYSTVVSYKVNGITRLEHPIFIIK